MLTIIEKVKKFTKFNLILFLILSFSYLPGFSVAYAANVSGAVKMGFLFNFFKFVEWPEGDTAQAFQLCIGEGHDLGTSVSAINGKEVNGRRIQLRHTSASDNFKSCHLVFLPMGFEGRRSVLQQIRGLPILTVGDGDGFLDEGGMISLIQDDNHLVFEVNMIPAKNAKLQISAQLLKLAKNVKGSG